MSDLDLARRFRDAFLAIARARLDRAGAALAASGGAAAFAAELHALAGEAAVLGLVELAEVARTGERAAADPAAAAHVLARIGRALDALGGLRPRPVATTGPIARGSFAGAAIRRARRVLIVEDSAIVAAKLAEEFARAGFDVEVVGALGPALAAARARAPDVVVTDVRLADGDGGELCRALRADGSTARIWLISAADDAELARRAAAVGATGHISKRAGIAALVARAIG
jgi:CheY-like chemotaxis protein